MPEGLRRHVRIFDESLCAVEREYPARAQKLLSNEALKKMLNTLVGDLIRETARSVKAGGVPPWKMFGARRNGWSPFRPQIEELRREAKQHLYRNSLQQ